jgi:predicted RNA-binding Zn-ribbon protein involved in translation (DUF1610 family)
MTRPTLIIPAVKCPKCGAVSHNRDRLGRSVLCCVGSRVIGRTRHQDYSCRACGATFIVLWRFDWQSGTASAKATIVNA